MATVSIFPESGDIFAVQTACRITVEDAEVNNDDGTQHRYRFRFTPPSGDETLIGSGYSYLFNVSQDGKHEFNSFIFPTDGSWTVALHDEEDDSDVDTLAVTVDPPEE